MPQLRKLQHQLLLYFVLLSVFCKSNTFLPMFYLLNFHHVAADRRHSLTSCFPDVMLFPKTLQSDTPSPLVAVSSGVDSFFGRGGASNHNGRP